MEDILEILRDYVEGILKAVENPIRDKPLTDFEQGVIAGKLKLARELKSIIEKG